MFGYKDEEAAAETTCRATGNVPAVLQMASNLDLSGVDDPCFLKRVYGSGAIK